MTTRHRVIAAAAATCAAVLPALAQSSASYGITDRTFNAGAHPAQGQIMSSTGFRMTLDSIGDAIAGVNLASASFHMDASFAATYPPPGEVRGMAFSDRQTLVWQAERSAGLYHLYRDQIGALPGLGYGLCAGPGLTAPTATDPATPPAGSGWFYLVTAENRLLEEGTKGTDSGGTERGNPNPCP